MVSPALAAVFATTSAICSDEPAVTPKITALSFFSPHPVKRMEPAAAAARAPTKKRRCIIESPKWLLPLHLRRVSGIMRVPAHHEPFFRTGITIDVKDLLCIGYPSTTYPLTTFP